MSYSIDTFLKPLTDESTRIIIKNTDSVIKYSIDPFDIKSERSINNLIRILTKFHTINIDFSTTNESREALIKLRSQVETLKERAPLYVDKKLENYIFQQTSEISNTPGATAGVVTYDYNSGDIWYHSTISMNFTASFVNLPTLNNRSINSTIIISQGPTAYVPNNVKIAGITQSIKWENGATPSGNANKIDIVGITFIRSGATWSHVLGQISTFG